MRSMFVRAAIVVLAAVVLGAVALSVYGPGLSPRSSSGTGVETVSATGTSGATPGLELRLAANATVLQVGQRLNVSVSLFNTYATPNAFWGRNPASEAGSWAFHGVPVATWPECTPGVFFFGWQYPVDVLILKGNYTAQGLSSMANASLSAGPCAAGGTASPRYTFQPGSDLVNVTYYASGGAGWGGVGLFQSTTHFTAGGYWNMTSLAAQAPTYDYCVSALPDVCDSPEPLPFVPGVYTLAASSEWGQTAILRFIVAG